MDNKGFVGALFDLSFTEFVTTRLIKFLFVLAIILAAIAAFVVFIGGISTIMSGYGYARTLGLLSIILSPVVFFLYVLGARIWLELLIVVFRIAENTGKLVEQGKQSKNES